MELPEHLSHFGFPLRGKSKVVCALGTHIGVYSARQLSSLPLHCIVLFGLVNLALGRGGSETQLTHLPSFASLFVLTKQIPTNL